MALKPCHLSQLLIDESAEQFIVFIAEREGARRIPIVIGQLEAQAIDRAVKGQPFARPLTHDLLVQVIDRCGLRLDEVRITDLREGIFYAELALSGPAGPVVIDCRPSDALAVLARRPGTPLLVAEAVLAAAGN
jgi:bifunctional DNase/RNase